MRYQIERFPKVSVVVPSYNQAGYLRETLESLVTQRYPNLEVILVDGGSTDGSLEVVKEYADRLAHWESEKDRGQAHAINKGFARATGEVLCWLNSDDVLLPGALNAVAYGFNAHPDWEWISAPSLKFGEGLHELSGFYELPKDAAGWMVHCPISQPSTFWRRSLYERHGGLDESFHYALDYEYWVRFVVGGTRLHFVERPLSAYRLHGESKTVAQAEKFATEEARIREKHIPSLSPGQRSKLARLLGRDKAISQVVEAVAVLQDGEWGDARRRLFGAIRSRPGILLTRTGVASLYRVLAKRPRYSE
jgi:GT2 family glycosyltransferase